MLNTFKITLELFHEALRRKEFIAAVDYLHDIQTACYTDSDWEEMKRLWEEFHEAEDREEATKCQFSLDDLMME